MNKNSIINSLKSTGYRVTEPRKKVSYFIEKHTGIFCANDILHTYKNMDKTSVYRTLDILETLQLVTPLIRIDGQQFYERFDDDKKGHHHHVICRSCKKTKCVSCHITLPKISGYSQLIHSSVFTGMCNSCK